MRNRVITLLCLAIALLIGGNIIVFDNTNTFSITENRELSSIEPLSIQWWISGSFQESIENTLADHFVARKQIVRTHNNITMTLDNLMRTAGELAFDLSFDSQIEVQMINKTINLVTINGERRLVRKSNKFNQEVKDFVRSKVELLNNLKSEYSDVNFYSYFVTYPHHSKVVYPNNNIDCLVPIIETLDFPVDFFEIESIEDYTKYFYATDHHWNHVASYRGYCEIAELMLVNKNELLVPKGLICHDEIEFWGSHSRNIAHSVYIEPDAICNYIFDLPEYSLFINGGQKDNYGNLDEYLTGEILEKDEKGFDHYNNINQKREAIIKFDTDRNNLDNLLVISDSMSNPIRELLAAHYNESTFINLYFYNKEIGEFSMADFIDNNDIDNVLIFLVSGNIIPNGEIKHLK